MLKMVRKKLAQIFKMVRKILVQFFRTNFFHATFILCQFPPPVYIGGGGGQISHAGCPISRSMVWHGLARTLKAQSDLYILTQPYFDGFRLPDAKGPLPHKIMVSQTSNGLNFTTRLAKCKIQQKKTLLQLKYHNLSKLNMLYQFRQVFARCV